MSNNNNDLGGIVNFFFETGIFEKIPRSGNAFLGSEQQLLSSHIFRTTVIGFSLAHIASADVSKVTFMCLFHDIEESRTGDLNYLQQRYVDSDDRKALEDITDSLPFGESIKSLIDEYEAQESFEAKLAKDADTLELILHIKETLDKGNEQATNWLKFAEKRLKTIAAKDILKNIKITKYYHWWYNLSNEWQKGNKNW
ncbi:MAG: HD domain-containing protein [Flexistipes sinusarabici]|uniref:HD domain-containing protein n=1 Tax=Flexistipes sinusarabici TaxID=2352 RepID=A0A5D0MXU3_FLESI|nr:HD domain-containing protein [Flexistipes sinusarabici]TYB37000.1 MAG: HD domain-containing protein [Flexistipes sinusarabici]